MKRVNVIYFYVVKWLGDDQIFVETCCHVI